ncbi:MAG: right-handed parallel beta-helix repeat-containing protein, partial [Microbacteriaceae bacterium]
MPIRRFKFLAPVVVAAVLSASISFPQVAFAVEQDLFVDDGPSLTCDNAGTAVDPFQSVQCAIDAASAGNTIRVAAGDYAGFTVNKALTILGPKAATSPATSDDATSAWGDASGWAVVKAASGRVVQVTAAADGTVIKGFAITSTNGNVTPAANGVFGINLLGADNITIQNNYFYDLYNVAITTSGAPATPRATSYLIDSNLIANAKGPFDYRGSYYGTEVAAVNPWYINDLTFSNNRISGYGRGVQLEENSGAVVRSNYISDIFYHGIQAANGQANTLIEGNTVDRAQMAAYYEYFYGGYCSGAIRLWTVDTSSGFVVRNNLVSNTGATQRTDI